jgi:GT2 family glycosyltransferase
MILSKPRVSIIVTTCNALAYTRRCVNSIRRYTRNVSYELIIVDNNSQDGTVEYLSGLKKVKLIMNVRNLGAGSAARQGVLASNKYSRFILFLDNDTEVLSQDWLYSMTKYLENNPKVGCLGPKYCLVHGADYNSDSDKIKVRCLKKVIFEPQRAKKISGNNFTKKELVRLSTFIDGDSRRVSVEIGGWCQMHRRSLINKIGLPEDALLPALKSSYWDSECSIRYLLLGYKIEDFGLEKTGKIMHYWHRNRIFNKDPEKYRSNLIMH